MKTISDLGARKMMLTREKRYREYLGKPQKNKGSFLVAWLLREGGPATKKITFLKLIFDPKKVPMATEGWGVKL